MILQELHIIGFKNIQEASLTFADKLNCLVGNNGQGKTNLLDAIYYLSFTKSAFNPIDSQNIRHNSDFAMIQGVYAQDEGKSFQNAGNTEVILDNSPGQTEVNMVSVTCSIKRGAKKQFRYGKTDYQRLLEHIGRIPLVMVSPEDNQLIAEGSDERRRFLDIIIGQTDRAYLEHLNLYNTLVKQRNALLKQYAEASVIPEDLFEVIEAQMIPHAEYIFTRRRDFVQAFIPIFQDLYSTIAEVEESPRLTYCSQLLERNLLDSLQATRRRDLILGWTSQGVHKDELEMYLGDYPLRRVGSQGQQKTYLIALKLAQALYLSSQPFSPSISPSERGQGGVVKPILLLDDIFDKLDAERVSRIVSLVRSDRFGQIFLTDTDRQHLTDIVRPIGELGDDVAPLGSSKVFYVHDGEFED